MRRNGRRWNAQGTLEDRVAARALLIGCAFALGCGSGSDATKVKTQAPDWDRAFEASFATPPATSRPWVRWWWPGGAVDDATLASEIARIDALGFGGVEVQPFRAGLSDADVAADPTISTVGAPAQLAHVRVAAAAARDRHLAFSLTLGSGWPSGGVFSKDVRPQELLYARVDVTGPATIAQALPVPGEPAWVATCNSVIPSVVGPFDPTLVRVAVLAAPIVDASASPPVLGAAADVSSFVTNDTLAWAVPTGPYAIVAIYQHPIAHHVVDAAFAGDPAGAFVINHLDPTGSSTWLTEQAGPYLDALAPIVPDEVFVDSPELLGELPWSALVGSQILTEKGYVVTPFLPWLFRQGGEAKYSDLLRGDQGPAAFASEDGITGVRAREDYEDVRAEIFANEYVAAIADFAAKRGSKFRFQAHGGWGVHLDDYAAADVPESETVYAGGSTDFVELAASAAHVAGRPVASIEAFSTLALNSAELPVNDLWMFAGRAFGAGIGRLVYHGMPYPREEAGGDPWYPFGTQFTNDFAAAGTSVWLPAFNVAITRLSWALTQGVDRAEVAWLLADRQISDHLAIGSPQPGQYEPDTSLALRSAGLVYDRISPSMLARSKSSAGALTVGSASYHGLLVSGWNAADPDALDATLAAARAGVPVVVLGGLPSRARGLADASTRDARAATSVTALGPLVHLVGAASDLAATFAKAGLRPAVSPRSTGCPVVTVRHREMSGQHVFFVFNEQQTACKASLSLGLPARAARSLDPETGVGEDLPVTGNDVSLTLPADRGRVLVVPSSP